MVPTNKKLLLSFSSLRTSVCSGPKQIRLRILPTLIALVILLPVLATTLGQFKPQKAEAINTSSTINFQARILTPAGSLVPDGYYNIRFKIYSGGTQGGPAGTGQANAGSQLWTESYYDSNGVTAGNDNRLRVVNGYVSVNLGSQTAFSGINWDQELWLTMDVGGTTQTATPTYDGEMLSSTPAANSRLKLTAVPYAFRAGQLAQTTGTNVSTLSFATQTAANAILLPDAGGTVCLQNASACGFAASTGAAGYIQNGTSLQASANFNIQSAANTSVGGVIQGATSQSADLLQFKDSTGAILTAFDASGKLVFGPSGSQDTNLYRSAANTLKTDDSLVVASDITGNGSVLFQNTTNSTTALSVKNSSGTTLLNVDTTNSKIDVNSRLSVTADGTSGSNLVANPSLESGLSGWNCNVACPPFTFTTTTSWFTAGAQAGWYKVNSAGQGGVNTDTGVSGMPVSAGTTYFARADINVIQAHTNGAQIRIDWYNSGGTFLSSNSSAAQTGTGVKLLSVNATAPAGAAYASIALGTLVGGPLNTVEFYWDSVSMTSAAAFDVRSSTGTVLLGADTVNMNLNVNGTALFKNQSNSTTAFQIQNTSSKTVLTVDTSGSQIMLGDASDLTGKILFYGSGGAGTLTLQGPTTPNAGNYTLSIPAITGNANICTDNSVCTGYAASTGAAGYIQNGTSLQSSANFNIQSAATGSVGGIIKGASGQTADIFQIQSNSAILAAFNASGQLVFGPSGSQDTNLYRSAADVLRTSDSLVVDTNLGIGATPSSTRLQITSSTTDTLLKITDTSGTSTDVLTIADGGATIHKTATDTNNAFQVQNSAGDNVINLGTAAYSSVNANLITNSSFESGAGGWSGKNGAGNSSGSAATAATAYMGSAYGVINASATGHGKSYAVTLLPSTSYTLSMYVKLTSGTMTTLVLGRQDQSGTDVDCAASPTIGTSWTRVSCIFTTGGTISSSNVYVKQSDGATRTIQIDAAQLVAGSSLTSFNNGELAVNTTVSRRLVVAGSTSSTGQIFEVQSTAGTQIFGVDTDSSTTIITGTAAINGDITSTSTTFNLLQSTVTTLNIGAAVGSGGINLAGGSASTGCTIDGSNGNLTCSGAIATTATTGTQGWWSRSGTTLQPATSGDNVTTTGNISTTSSGTITSAGLLTGSAGLTVTGAVNLNSGTAAGAIAIGNNTGNTAVTIDSGTATIGIGTGGQGRTINIGTGAAAQAVTLGSTDTSSATSIQGGVSGSINIGSVGSSTLSSTVHIGDTSNATGSQAITIGSAVAQAGNLTTIQGGSSTTAGTEAIRILPSTAGSIAIGASGGTGTITLGQSTANNTVNIGTSSSAIAGSATQTINIGNGSLTNASSSIAVNILSGSAGTNGTASLLMGNNDRVTQIDIGNVAADAARTINVGTGNNTVGIDTLNIGTGNTSVIGGKTINIGTGTPSGSGTNLITIGALTNASKTTIQGGTAAGGITLSATGSASTGVVVKNGNNSTAAFQIQNAAGTSSVLTADTLNQAVTVDYGWLTVNGLAMPSGTGGGKPTITTAGGGTLGAGNYRYRVAAYNNAGTASNSVDAFSTFYNTGTITQTGTAITGSGTTFTAGMNGYIIYYSDGTQSTVTYVDATHLTTASNKYLPAGSSYVLGNPVIATGATGRNTITWTAVTGASGYYVLRSIDNGATYQGYQVVGGSTTSLIDTGGISFNFGGGADYSWLRNTNQTSTIALGSGGKVCFESSCALEITSGPNDGNLYIGNYNSKDIRLEAGGLLFEDTLNGYANEFLIQNGGQVYFQNAVNSVNAFQVQNVAGNKLLAVDTTTAAPVVYIGVTGTTALSGTINIANTTGAGVAQTVNIGSTTSTSSITLQAGSTGVALKSGSSTAFQIQNAAATDTMFIADTTTTNKIKIGNSTGTGTSTTVFQLDAATAAPFGTGQTAYLGSMYYDSTQGKLQCYESRNGTAAWGACGSAPNNIITLTPEYTGAVLNGTGVGTMTADFCSNESAVLVVGTLCATHETRNFYKWTSPQSTSQTYSIYVNYKLPSTFSAFNDANTIKLTALSDNTANASATLQVFRKNVVGNAITSCGSATTINSSSNTWQQTSFGGNETTCGFVGGDYVIFKIDVTAKSSSNIYVENLDFTYTNT